MKLGIGLYRHMLNNEYYDFARQCGCSDLIIHLADYYNSKDNIVMATNDKINYGISKPMDAIWELNSINALVKETREKGLNIHAIENFSPADWYDILLDGPQKQQQLENLKHIITNVGKAGIKHFGYNFSFAGVWGHMKTRDGRGNAEFTCFSSTEIDINTPIPKGEIWNMTYADNQNDSFIDEVGYTELWQRLEWFLQNILPVAEEAGVQMALHPDDPPMPMLRKTPRLVYQPHMYQNVLDLVPSKSNGIDFCMGSIQEMTEGNIYESLAQYADKISYVHVRNVIGKVPHYKEVFVDEGDIDISLALKILHENSFKGVLIPDHTPQMTCSAGWHAGMAYALGYIKSEMKHLGY